MESELSLVSRAGWKAAMRQLRGNPEAGKPLRGRLGGCRSLRIGGSENRLVYRILADEDAVEVLAIGRRRDEAVYERAVDRV